MAIVQWTPALLSTALWLDASDASTLTISTGTNVSEFRDKKGNGLSVAQATAASQPTKRAAHLNGRDVIAFSGSQWLENPLALPIVDMALFFVARRESYVYYGPLCGAEGTGATDWTSPDGYAFNYQMSSTEKGAYFEHNNSIQLQQLPDPADPNSIRFIGVDIAPSADALMRVNGETRATDTEYSGSAAKTTGMWMIGKRPHGYLFHGYIAEMVYVSNHLGAGEREKLEGYLAHKWGLLGLVPPGHPYKAAAPTVSVDLVAEVNTGYAVDTSIGAKTAMMPGTPKQFDKVSFADYAGSFGYNALTIYANNKPIEGRNVPIVLSGTGESIELTFFDDTTGWMVTG